MLRICKFNIASIIKIYPDIEFHIIGEISKFDKFIFERENKVKVHNKVRNLEPYLNNVICGLANLNISLEFKQNF